VATGLVVRQVGAAGVTTQASVSVTGLPMWFAPGALVAISSIAGVTTQASVSVTGLPVWFNPTAALRVSGVTPVFAAPASGETGIPVWAAPAYNEPVLMMVTVTSSIIPPTTLIFTVWTGSTQAAAGVGAYVVPAGKRLRIVNFQAVVVISNVAQVNRYALLVSTAAVTMTATVGIGCALAIPLTVQTKQEIFPQADFTAGATLAFGVDVGNTRHCIVAMIAAGYLF
jgi:hypothetical protein